MEEAASVAQQHTLLLSRTQCSMSAPFSSGRDRQGALTDSTSSRTGRWDWPPVCLAMRPTLCTGCGPHRGQGRLPMWFAVWPADRWCCVPKRLATWPRRHTAAVGPIVGGTSSSLRAYKKDFKLALARAGVTVVKWALPKGCHQCLHP